MMFGVILIAISFIAGIISTTSYWLYYKDQQQSMYRLANGGFIITGIGISISLFYLIFLIMNNQFDVNYVYSYSSTELNRYYLFSTLWAGQQGTFLMWIFYGFLYGLVLMKFTAKKNPLTMFFLGMVQCFILLILLRKSPFTMIWHDFAEVPIGFMPSDGAGLNPLLQNPWMVIHPPTLFVGYSSTVVPFLFAMSAMVRNDFQNWIVEAKQWILFNIMILGIGIVMGGYWAYITLGWGGYWGWDPVENASLVPWIFSIVLLHGVIIQKKRKSLVRTNFLWAGLSFLSMLWGSYLTRSGVLSDFSVHSFAPSDLSVYLIAFQVLFTGMFLFLWIRSMINYNKLGENPVAFGNGILNRETMMFFGMSTLIFIGILVLAGTASPLYSQLWGDPISLSPDFYNTMILPIAFFLFLTMAIAPTLAWKTSEFRNKPLILGALGASLILTLAAAALGLGTMTSIGQHTPFYAIEGTVTPAFFDGIRDSMFNGALKYSPFLLFFLAVFLIIINARVAWIFITRNFSKAGGYIAHVGWGFMLIGTVTSSVYDTSEKVMLPKGEFTRFESGYEIKFVSFVDMTDGKDRVKLVVKTQSGKEYNAYPQFYYSEYTKGYMVSPDVKTTFGRDIYISPISFTPARLSNQEILSIRKAETKPVGDLKVTFHDFKVKMGQKQEVTANLTVEIPDGDEMKAYDVTPIIIANQGDMQRINAKVGNSGYEIEIETVNANIGEVTLNIISPPEEGAMPRDQLAIELSEKPFISLMWFGTIVFALGTFFALTGRLEERFSKKYAKKRKQKIDA